MRVVACPRFGHAAKEPVTADGVEVAIRAASAEGAEPGEESPSDPLTLCSKAGEGGFGAPYPRDERIPPGPAFGLARVRDSETPSSLAEGVYEG